MKPLTKKEILKRHQKNLPAGKAGPKDKKLQKDIETKEIKRSDFNKLIQEASQQDLFDKKRSVG